MARSHYCRGAYEPFLRHNGRIFCAVCHRPFKNIGDRTNPEYHSTQRPGGFMAVLCQKGQHSRCRDWMCQCPEHWGGEVQTQSAPVAVDKVIERIDLNEQTAAQVEVLREHVNAQTLEAQTFRAETADRVTEFQNRLAALDSARPIVIQEKSPKGKVTREIKLEAQHMTFQKLLTRMQIRKANGSHLNVFLRGPAGSFKTSAAKAVAEALGVPYYHVPLGPQTSESKLVGYMDAHSQYVITMARQAYEFGGVCLFDEMDAANPGVLTIINGMTDNGVAGFADKMVKRHPDCYFIAAGNTYGRGADEMYVGRARLDAATLDRYLMLNWEYDWEMLERISGNPDWTRYVKQLFDRASDIKAHAVIGSRAVLDGAAMLAAGIDSDEVEDERIWNPIDTDLARAIRDRIPSFKAQMAAKLPVEPTDPEPGQPIDVNALGASATAPTSCPKCGGTVRDNREANSSRRVNARKPLPDLICAVCGDSRGGYKVWPTDYNWDTQEWTS